ncbi:hypothetical protein KAR91_31170 [Candidatus Pacearchaeota archaeon]|nr:hypothetical protein [Candidatus Pacearchaeota archaeon]
MVTSKLRGHDMFSDKKGNWFYCDTKESTIDNERDCGYCGKNNNEQGHDGCLGTLPNVMNACCGHGIQKDAFIQYWSGIIVQGREALLLITKAMKEGEG